MRLRRDYFLFDRFCRTSWTRFGSRILKSAVDLSIWSFTDVHAMQRWKSSGAKEPWRFLPKLDASCRFKKSWHDWQHHFQAAQALKAYRLGSNDVVETDF